MNVRPRNWQVKQERCQNSACLTSCALCCTLIVLSIYIGYYHHFLFWIILGLTIAIFLAWERVNSRRRTLQWQRRMTIWENVSKQSFALTLDEARQQLSPLLTDQTLFSTVPATSASGHLEAYPPSLRELYNRYETVCIEGLVIGPVLPSISISPHETVFEYFTISAPYHLVGYDTSFDHDGEPLVIKDTAETLYTLEAFDEPDPGETYLGPSVIHYVLARARLAQEITKDK